MSIRRKSTVLVDAAAPCAPCRGKESTESTAQVDLPQVGPGVLVPWARPVGTLGIWTGLGPMPQLFDDNLSWFPRVGEQ